MNRFIKNLKKYHRYAIKSAKAELKSEVADSHLNWLWWVIEPICFMLIYTFIFTIVFKNSTPYFPAFVFIGQTVWDFFNRMLSGSVKLILNNRDLVTKVYIPKYILLLSKSYTYLFKMGISLAITFILMVALKVPFTWHMLWIIPILIVLYIFCFGMGMILMHFGVTINDLGNLMNIALRMIFYMSGVFYNIAERLDGTIAFILLKANPSAMIMHQMRIVMLEGRHPGFYTLGAWLVIGVVLCAIGVNLIHKYENSYAKVI